MRPKRSSRKNIVSQNSMIQQTGEQKKSFSSEHIYNQIKSLQLHQIKTKYNQQENQLKLNQRVKQDQLKEAVPNIQAKIIINILINMEAKNFKIEQRDSGTHNQREQILQDSRAQILREKTLAGDNISKNVNPQLNILKKNSLNTINSIQFGEDFQEQQSPQHHRNIVKRKDLNSSIFMMGSKFKHNFQSFQQKLDWIRENAIGINTTYISPLELQLQSVYVDHTATNRPFKSIETMIDHSKLFAANPHTQYSQFGKFSTGMMHYALQSHLRSFNANPNEYVVLPAGAGSTGAIKHAIEIITKNTQIGHQKDLTVFITPYEHHSNILPWVQFFPKLQVLVNDDGSSLIMPLVYEQLSRHPSSHMIISVSAASNVTSKLTDLKSLNSIIRELRQKHHKKIIFGVDCAAYCCHNQLNLKQLNQIDLAFISPHKNLGGAQTCGILVLRKSLLTHSKPSFPGGGTVAYVSGYHKQDILYDPDIFARQISGTPSFFAYYRSALSFELLKDIIGYDFIHQSQRKNTQLFFNLIKQNNAKLKSESIQSFIKIYGDENLNKRANVVPFNILFNNQNSTYYHLIGLILSDIFGIQVRSGCFCAGPYGIQLLSLKNQNLDIQKIKQQIEQGNTTNKPGFIRVDMTFYLKQFQIKYIAKAIFYIAKFYKNIQKLYNIDQNGKISLKNKLLKHKNHQYELRQVNQAYQRTYQHNLTNNSKLKSRKSTLEKQLKIGKSICQHPEDFVN